MIARANDEEPVLAIARCCIRAQILAARPLVRGPAAKPQAYNGHADLPEHATMASLPTSGDDAAVKQTRFVHAEYNGKMRQTRHERHLGRDVLGGAVVPARSTDLAALPKERQGRSRAD